VKVESDALQEVCQHFKFNVTSTRRALRQSKGTGNFRSNDNVVHRSEECKKIFNIAESLAGDNGILNVLILMAAIMADPGEKIGQIFKDAGVEIIEFRNRLMDQASRVVIVNADEPGIAENAQKSYLQKFGRDLTQDARDGKLYPFVGRQKELTQIINTLARSSKNNPVLVGEPGVGKTAVVEALATHIISGTVPEFLKDKKIIELNMGVLVAGTLYRGEFEQRITKIIEEAKADPTVILFIDELHTLVGAGRAGGSLDAANIIKPSLARGELKCIGATTLSEYRRYIEKDAALERRFECIPVDEPSRQECIEMLKGVKQKLEDYHGVLINDLAIESAVDLSVRFDTDHRLPDKAIDLLDRASARIRTSNKAPDACRTPQIISELTIAETLAETSRIPVEVISGHLVGNFKNHLAGLPDRLKALIIGQSDAIERVTRRLFISYSGISKRKGPLAVFLFLGSSGVGKTELAKQLACELFGSDKSLIRLDMSEFKEEHSVSKLIGSPPGYVGYEEDGQLTGKLRTRPYSVLLLDEVEKAHPRVFDLFLQVFDEGNLTDSKGRHVDASNCLVVMTSNIKIKKNNKLGFGEQVESIQHDDIPELKDFFKPEFLNRIDEQIIFGTLDRNDMLEIINKLISELEARIDEKYKTSLHVSDEVKDYIIGITTVDRGVRGLQRIMEQQIEAPLGVYLLNNSSARAILVKLTDGNIEAIGNGASGCCSSAKGNDPFAGF
jgi:ATP-dependent Clp protease ATP-binding subunit ClpC